VGRAAVAEPDRVFPCVDRVVPVAALTVDLTDFGPHLGRGKGVPRTWVRSERFERVEPVIASRRRAVDRCGQLEHRRRSAHRRRLYGPSVLAQERFVSGDCRKPTLATI